MAQAIGGWRGLVDSALPTLLFVTVAAFGGLRPAVFAALALAALLLLVRVARREPLRYAVGGCFGVAISALVALRLGKTEGFFLPGIIANAAYCAVFLGSIAVRRPLVGLILAGLGRPVRGKRAARVLLLATAGWALICGARAAVQWALYAAGSVGWLAAVRLAMGWPLTLVALVLTVAAVRSVTVDQNSVGVAGSSPRSPS